MKLHTSALTTPCIPPCSRETRFPRNSPAQNDDRPFNKPSSRPLNLARTILLIVFAPCVLFAEEYPIDFGLVGGLNSATMQGSELDALEAKYGNSPQSSTLGSGGIRVAYALKQWLKFESGVFLSGKGFEIKVQGQSGVDWSGDMPHTVDANYYFARRITFLEIPATLRLQTPYFSSQQVSLYAITGLRFGFVVSAAEKYIEETVTSNFPDQGSSTDRNVISETDLFETQILTDTAGHQIHYSYDAFYRRFDIALTIGGGIEKRYNSVGFFLEGQYQHGFMNFNNLSATARKELAQFNSTATTSNTAYFGQPEAFFYAMQVSVGINIYIAKHDGTTDETTEPR